VRLSTSTRLRSRRECIALAEGLDPHAFHAPNIPREDQPQRSPPAPPGPVPTLGELQTGSTKWVWAICNGLDESGRVACLHRAPLALAPFVLRWGTEASSNVMRQRLRCAVCGHRAAVLQHPSWIDAQIGEQPFRSNGLALRRAPGQRTLIDLPAKPVPSCKP
jgi:hypothetical protein